MSGIDRGTNLAHSKAARSEAHLSAEGECGESEEEHEFDPDLLVDALDDHPAFAGDTKLMEIPQAMLDLWAAAEDCKAKSICISVSVSSDWLPIDPGLPPSFFGPRRAPNLSYGAGDGNQKCRSELLRPA